MLNPLKCIFCFYFLILDLWELHCFQPTQNHLVGIGALLKREHPITCTRQDAVPVELRLSSPHAAAAAAPPLALEEPPPSLKWNTICCECVPEPQALSWIKSSFFTEAPSSHYPAGPAGPPARLSPPGVHKKPFSVWHFPFNQSRQLKVRMDHRWTGGPTIPLWSNVSI